MGNNNTKNKLKVLNTAGCKMLLMDVLQTADMWIHDEHGESPEDYAMLVENICKELRGRYKKELLPEVRIYNRDLEELIQAVKDGKE